MIRRIALASGLLLATGASAQSVAVIDQIEGAVTINQGEQFVAAIPGQAVNANDRVMASDGASAVVRFTDGCDLYIEQNTLVTIPSTSTCAGGVALLQSIAPSGGSVVGGAAVSTGGGSTLGTIGWVAGGVLLAAGIYDLVEDDDDTASP